MNWYVVLPVMIICFLALFLGTIAKLLAAQEVENSKKVFCFFLYAVVFAMVGAFLYLNQFAFFSFLIITLLPIVYFSWRDYAFYGIAPFVLFASMGNQQLFLFEAICVIAYGLLSGTLGFEIPRLHKNREMIWHVLKRSHFLVISLLVYLILLF